MLTIIENVLSPEEVVAALRFMDRGDFNDGKLTAGKMAIGVKKNLELDQGSDVFAQLNSFVFNKLTQHPQFQAAALPNKIAAPFYARYTPGMRYGYHVDDPIMGEGPRFRTDVSTTLFLCDPDTYEGGATTIKTEFGEQKVKLAAGSAVVYPSSSLHRVEEVTKGERQVMITWAQSMVRAPDKRAILYDLWKSRESLLADNPKGEDAQRIDHSYVNLIRMWAEV